MDDIALPDVVEISKAHAALKALRNFLDIVLEAFQSLQLAFEDDLSLALDAHDRIALNLAVYYIGPANYEVLADLEELAYLRRANLHFLLERLDQALNCLLEVVGYLIDDAVGTNVDAGLLRHLGGVLIGFAVEADDDAVGRGRQVDVVFRDVAGSHAQDAHLHLFAGQSSHRVGNRL